MFFIKCYHAVVYNQTFLYQHFIGSNPLHYRGILSGSAISSLALPSFVSITFCGNGKLYVRFCKVSKCVRQAVSNGWLFLLKIRVIQTVSIVTFLSSVCSDENAP